MCLNLILFNLSHSDAEGNVTRMLKRERKFVEGGEDRGDNMLYTVFLAVF